eukprot:comp23767_c6_seq1/m.41185 comp23767_c6_seq1/g.41185  ORF comp23767_c6_seq1/g.41185 comp23767_c6_seq1/m.41185 type:complete len:345 (-) comp23767_c6_seq1:143-1177(-)
MLSFLLFLFILWLLWPTGLQVDMMWQGIVLEVLTRMIGGCVVIFEQITGKPSAKISRDLFSAMTGGKKAVNDPNMETTDTTLTADNVPLRIYRHKPDQSAASVKSRPGGVVFIHGGGWCRGNIQSHDAYCRLLAKLSGFTVVSVEYSLSPEAKFPVALNECYGVTKYISTHPDEFGIDNTKIVVAGDSAGGNLTAGVCLKAREEPWGGPAIRGQILIYPALDNDFFNQSYVKYARVGPLYRERAMALISGYISKTEDLKNPYLLPMSAKTLSGLPEAYVLVAEHDILRDEGLNYARRLQKEGVQATTAIIKKGFHACATIVSGPLAPKESIEAVGNVAKWLQTL